jgi:hypothetical protein
MFYALTYSIYSIEARSPYLFVFLKKKYLIGKNYTSDVQFLGEGPLSILAFFRKMNVKNLMQVSDSIYCPHLKTLRKTCHCEEVRRSNLSFAFQSISPNYVSKAH